MAAPAKLNLGLHVLAKRGDGFHELDTVFATLTLSDEVTVTVDPGAPEGAVSGELEADDGVPGAAALPVDEDNLAVRAARVYLDAYAAGAAPPGAHVRLHKRIPVAAGLGGGSSDAAAVLRALAELLPAEVDPARLALGLGSDVPFFVRGLAAARGRGRGERLTPLALPPRHVVLAFPGTAVPVAEAYAALQSFSPRLDPERLIRRLGEGAAPGWTNTLQAGVVRRWPSVRAALDALRAEGLTGPLMSGSGSTCFALAEGADHAEQAERSLRRAHPDWWIASARFGGA